MNEIQQAYRRELAQLPVQRQLQPDNKYNNKTEQQVEKKMFKKNRFPENAAYNQNKCIRLYNIYFAVCNMLQWYIGV